MVVGGFRSFLLLVLTDIPYQKLTNILINASCSVQTALVTYIGVQAGGGGGAKGAAAPPVTEIFEKFRAKC